MTTIQTILLLTLLIIWLCFSVVFLITAVQSFIYDRKREKREREQAVTGQVHMPWKPERMAI